MGLHRDRDVVLLNSDAIVHGTWLERLKAAAYSDPKVATVNPLTNCSHISNYPFREGNDGITLEVPDDVLDDLAAEKNAGLYERVHTTVGFCMYIKRRCLDQVGLFDVRHFPIGYGEESDFCYRARKLGWRHLIAGNVFVRHLENQSFGERKAKLMQEMIPKFLSLHPDCAHYDAEFKRLDPLRHLRAGLDLARLKQMLGSPGDLRMYVSNGAADAIAMTDPIALVYEPEQRGIRIVASNGHVFPNLDPYKMPKDIVRFNAAMRYLGIGKIVCGSVHERAAFEKQIVPKSIELELETKLDLVAEAG